MKSSSGDRALAHKDLLTNHGLVLAFVSANPEARLRDIAEAVGITERTAVQIVRDLEDAGYLARTRSGRRNRYTVRREPKVRVPAVSKLSIAELLVLLQQTIDQQPFA